MALSLDQYACEYLPGRGLPWPTPPAIKKPKAKPSLEKFPVRAVLWNVYGTLLAIPGGELKFEADLEFVTDAAFDKTIQEFKMWNSMSRKPGAPSAYMREVFKKAHDMLKVTGGGEVRAELIWEDIIKKLGAKEYSYDAVLYGTPAEYAKKIAYFYHASIQGYGAYPGAAEAVRMIGEAGIKNGLLMDGQCFTGTQLTKSFLEQDPHFILNAAFPSELRILSVDHKARKPQDTLFRAAITSLRGKGISPEETLHVGSSLARDIAPAKKHGMLTALFAGDKNSLVASAEELNDPLFRPDVLITELTQLHGVVAP